MSIRSTLTAATIIICIAAAAFPFVGQSPAAADQPAPVAQPVPEAEQELDSFGIYGADAAAEAMIVEAIEIFANAGMDLPELRIYVHTSHDECLGNQGLYSLGGDHNRVDICTVAAPLILHELAHAWEYHNVAQEIRETFTAQAGLTVWNDHDVMHQMRGVEVAAHTITWGLSDEPIHASAAGHHAEDLELFELLTGAQTPRLVEWSGEKHTIDADVVADLDLPDVAVFE